MGFDFLIEDGRSSGDTLLLQEKLVPNVYLPQSALLEVETHVPNIYHFQTAFPEVKRVSRTSNILTQFFQS